MIKIKKIFIILLFFSNYLFAQTIEPLTNYSFENIVEEEKESEENEPTTLNELEDLKEVTFE